MSSLCGQLEDSTGQSSWPRARAGASTRRPCSRGFANRIFKGSHQNGRNTSNILWAEGRHTSSEVLPSQGLVIYIGSRNMQLPWQQRHEAALVVTKVSAPLMSVRACRGRAHGWSICSCASSLAALVVNHFLIMLDLGGLD